MKLKFLSILSCALLFLLAACNTRPLTDIRETRFNLIPYPTQLIAGSGNFTVTPSTKIVVNSNLFIKEAEMLSALLSTHLEMRCNKLLFKQNILSA